MSLTKFIVSFYVLAFASIAQANPVSIRAEVNGMVCAFCAQGIEAKLRKHAATKNVFVNLKHRVVAVELLDGQSFSLDKFKADILESGYAVTKVEYVNDTVAAIKAATAR
jgi:periplasmic mercuric ion binding protein